ncbi:MAG: Putative two component transcriptional regulator, LuxR family [Leptospirillum sp. Group II 'C75']|jgi:DNA-binding NarL/FixJ family response regulator|uniref:Transcriptional regulator n=2 Tax=Leptospirillum ferriphilum TaxID=178606 RepID=A0A059XXT2_9BACT|nr:MULTISPECIES: response regulator transcription factor [Leptospirillum]EAY57537.1 MAG: putative two component transcriptional regulator, LuxR family [Leptospirillum rubarum]EIJ75851.1 MAG: Putative two component transcriptional regulator, LuxR family [Leptospirillum sp. Group II 'C75']AIA30106.1 transcriptional regulator [Leptospirillum ferriphilum YSK]AKS22963.1 transcriptional regulator [Leptospirillum sp. Group II 'CF-1']OOH72931.1 DNA-binding response regulator [Leptospirillum ferriphilu
MIRVFLVEDHGLMRTALKKTLEKTPDITFAGEAESAEEALRILVDRKAPVDVVIMDIGLPGESGITATRVLRQARPEVRVVMYTVHRVEAEIFSSFSAGADGYCLKDTTVDSLLLAIRAAGMGSVYLDPAIAHLALNRIRVLDYPANDNPLSPRETEILKLLSKGLSNREIGDIAGISLSTVKAHIQSILEKLSASTRADAAVKAIKKGLI